MSSLLIAVGGGIEEEAGIQRRAVDAAERSLMQATNRYRGGLASYLEVTVAGQPDPVTGMALDLERLDETVGRAVLERVDHHTLEGVDALRGVITTGEGLARAFWRVLQPEVGAATLRRVTVVETAKNRFDYRGGA